MPVEDARVSSRRFDLSRDTFDPAKHFRSVINLQGRVSVEADENEQRRIELHRADTTTADVIGPAGYPQGTTGFLIAASGSDLTIGAGRMYVDGILCECEGSTLLTQPDMPRPTGITKVPGFVGTGTYAVYLDVWERDVTVLEDPTIRELALGGPDHAARTKTVWQVRLASVPTGTTCANVALPAATVHDGLLSARTDLKAATRDCVLPPLAGFQSKENQLYRVEIHGGGAAGVATFKWSRENASVIAPIDGGVGSLGATFTVAGLSADSTLSFVDNQWVELFDDAIEEMGTPGILAQIRHIDPPTRTVTLTNPVGGSIDLSLNPRMRRWDFDPAATGPIPASATWTNLEFGVQVQFDGGTYQPGDYWIIPARTAIDESTGTLSYPLSPQPAQHVARSTASLAIATSNGATFDATVLDCRLPFLPLTSIVQAVPAPSACDLVVTPGANWDAPLRALDSSKFPRVEICFATGIYTMKTPIEFKGFASVKMTGGGAGTDITCSAEVGFKFTQCDGVIVRDLAVRTLRVSEGRPSPDFHLGGPLTFLRSRDVTVENVTLACADGKHREAACLAIENDPGTDTAAGTGTVRIRGSRFYPGMMQIGILLVHVARATIEDNELRVEGTNVALDNPAFLKDAGYVARLARLFYGDLSFEKSKAKLDVQAATEARSALVTKAIPAKRVNTKGTSQPAQSAQAAQPAQAAQSAQARNASLRHGFTLVQGKTLMSFRGVPSLKGVYENVLAGAKVTSTADVTKLVRTTARRFVTDAAFRNQYSAVASHYGSAYANNPRTGARGISVGGRGFREIRLLNNTIDGFLQGITVGVSHYRPARRGDLDIGGSLTIAGNTISVRIPSSGVFQAKHAIYVGNVEDLTIVDNAMELVASYFSGGNVGQVHWALKLFGVHGSYLSVRNNRFDNFPLAIYTYHVATPNRPLPDVDTAFWEVTDNYVRVPSGGVAFTEGPGPQRITYRANKQDGVSIINTPL